MTHSPQPDAPPAGEAASPETSRSRTAATVAFLVLVAGVLALYRTTDRPLFTAHEARAGRCARHMLRSGAWPAGQPSPWLVPQFSPHAPPEMNYQKPPLYYWAVAAVSGLAGEVTRLTVRLPGAVSFVLLVLIVYFLGRTLVSHRTGLVAALVFASTPKVLWWGRAAVLDPMLTACIAGSLLCFIRAHLTSRERKRAVAVGAAGAPRLRSGQAPTRRASRGAWPMYLFWALAGLGTLVKATALVVPLLTVGLYLLVRWPAEGLRRPLARLRPLSGPLVLLAVAAPWHVAAHWATHGDFSRVYWGMHVFGRATGTSAFEETTDPWYYLPAMARDLFPWVVFLPGALVQVWRRASRPYRGRLLFPFAWLMGSLVFFSVVSFRKDEYMLAAYPAAAVLVGYFLDYYVETQESDARLRKWVVAAFVIMAVAAVGMAAGLLSLGLWPAAREALLEMLHNRTDRAVVSAVADLMAGRTWVAALVAGPMAVGAVASVVMVVRRRSARAVALTVCTTLLAFVLFVETIVPVLGRVRGLSDFADAVEAEARRRGPGTRVLLAVGECHELAFVLDERAEGLRAHPDASAFLDRQRAAGRTWLLVMDRRAWRRGQGGTLAAGWHVVAETPEGHRRPMVCLAPGAEKE